MSKSLLNAETLYTQLEKLALALITTARKLQPYFQSYPIIMLTTYLLKNILHKPKLFNWLTKWVVKLGEYDFAF